MGTSISPTEKIAFYVPASSCMIHSLESCGNMAACGVCALAIEFVGKRHVLHLNVTLMLIDKVIIVFMYGRVRIESIESAA